jgi:hypothetical protein
MSELGSDLLVKVVQTSRLDALDVLVDRINEDPEGEIAFEVCAGTRENYVTAGTGARSEMGQQARLADPCCADDLDRSGAALLKLVERVVELLKLGATPYEVVGEFENPRTS